ncbi:MAG: AraC family transcriptional regulator [Ruminiclostridium sp.]|nr:AraC family transcriptional regulator [Ruminiclostridium sp.]
MGRININFSIPIGDYVYSVTFLNNFGHSKSWSALRHNHSEIEVQFILSGECTILLGDTLAEVTAGNILIIAPQVYHAPIPPGPSADFEKDSFIFSFAKADKSNDIFAAAEAAVFADFFNSIEKFRIFEDCFCGANDLSKVIKEYKEMEPGYYTRILSIITGIIASLARCVAAEKLTSAPMPLKTLGEQRTAIIEGFFDYDYSLNRTQKELAAALSVSCRHLERILKKTCNRSYREKLLQSRMEVAADLLINTGMNISSIAAQLGYTTETGFYRSFYNYFKSTPASFRKSKKTK